MRVSLGVFLTMLALLLTAYAAFGIGGVVIVAIIGAAMVAAS